MSDLRSHFSNILWEIKLIEKALAGLGKEKKPPCCIKIQSNKMYCSFINGLEPEEFFKECLVCLNEVKQAVTKLKAALPGKIWEEKI